MRTIVEDIGVTWKNVVVDMVCKYKDKDNDETYDE